MLLLCYHACCVFRNSDGEIPHFCRKVRLNWEKLWKPQLWAISDIFRSVVCKR